MLDSQNIRADSDAGIVRVSSALRYARKLASWACGQKRLMMVTPHHWGQERSKVNNQTVRWPPLPLLVIKALHEPPRDRKKQKNTQYTKHKVSNTAWVMWPRSLAREPLGTIKDILGNSLSVGWNENGYYTHDIINDIKSCTEMLHDRTAEEKVGETAQWWMGHTCMRTELSSPTHTHTHWNKHSRCQVIAC